MKVKMYDVTRFIFADIRPIICKKCGKRYKAHYDGWNIDTVKENNIDIDDWQFIEEHIIEQSSLKEGIALSRR
jgi:hypothetical protein